MRKLNVILAGVLAASLIGGCNRNENGGRPSKNNLQNILQGDEYSIVRRKTGFYEGFPVEAGIYETNWGKPGEKKQRLAVRISDGGAGDLEEWIYAGTGLGKKTPFYLSDTNVVDADLNRFNSPEAMKKIYHSVMDEK